MKDDECLSLEVDCKIDHNIEIMLLCWVEYQPQHGKEAQWPQNDGSFSMSFVAIN